MCLCLHQSKQYYVLYSLQTTAAARDAGDIQQIVQHATSAQSLADVSHFFLLIVHKTQAAYVSREQRRKRTFHPSIFWRHSHISLLTTTPFVCRFQWPRGLRRGSTAAYLLGLWVRIQPEAQVSVVSVVCCQVEVTASGYHSSRGFLRIVVCPSVIMNPRKWGGGVLAHWGLLRHVKKRKTWRMKL